VANREQAAKNGMLEIFGIFGLQSNTKNQLSVFSVRRLGNRLAPKQCFGIASPTLLFKQKLDFVKVNSPYINKTYYRFVGEI